MLKKINIFIAVAIALAACKDPGVDGGDKPHPLTAKEVLGVYNDSKNLFVYDDEMHQYAFNTQKRTFRIQNTAQDRYFSCKLDEQPVEKGVVIMQVDTKGISSLPKQELQLDVVKVSDGKVWLWEPNKKLGFVIRLE